MSLSTLDPSRHCFHNPWYIAGRGSYSISLSMQHIRHHCRFYSFQGDINCSCEQEIWEEIIQNEVSLGGSSTINVTLVHFIDIWLPLSSCIMILFPPITIQNIAIRTPRTQFFLLASVPHIPILWEASAVKVSNFLSKSHLMAFVRTLGISYREKYVNHVVE